jgi:hypothetical protein
MPAIEVPMIDVKQAVKAAIDFAEETLGREEAAGARLEEIELSPDDAFWLITLGLPRRAALEGRTAWEALSGAEGKRDYKVFKVEMKTGKVVSMKMRNDA